MPFALVVLSFYQPKQILHLAHAVVVTGCNLRWWCSLMNKHTYNKHGIFIVREGICALLSLGMMNRHSPPSLTWHSLWSLTINPYFVLSSHSMSIALGICWISFICSYVRILTQLLPCKCLIHLVESLLYTILALTLFSTVTIALHTCLSRAAVPQLVWLAHHFWIY